MPKLLSFVLFIALFLCVKNSHSQNYYVCFEKCEGLRLYSLKSDQYKEFNYVSDNISDIHIFKNTNIVYINWHVCDDTTQCWFIIKKYINNEPHDEWTVMNIPGKIGMPILYSITDNKGICQTTIYKFFRMTNDGIDEFIATIIVPYTEDKN